MYRRGEGFSAREIIELPTLIPASQLLQLRQSEWLADVSRQVPVDLGVADVIEAATAEGTSFSLVETSYAADVSQITWSGQEPDGAT